MSTIENLKHLSGIVNESKYGQKFNQYYGPFKNEGKKVKDKNGKELCECDNADIAKELSLLLTDIKQMRELCDRIVSLPNR